MTAPVAPGYSQQEWHDNNPTYPLSALRLKHIEAGIAAEEAFTLAIEEYIEGQVQQTQQAAQGAGISGLAGMTALRKVLPTQPSAVVTSPAIALTNAVSGSTSHEVSAIFENAPNPLFSLSGAQYIQGGLSFPTNHGVRSFPRAYNPAGFGDTIAEFFSDAPIISFKQFRSQLGGIRVLVDDEEVLRCGLGIRKGTAQAGGASTITLDAGASATNGWYFTNWVHILSGTGAGQYRQISGYVGATKVATVSSAWTTQPDNTSVFEISPTRQTFTTLAQEGFSSYFFELNWGGERRLRRYRVECAGTTFFGCWTTGLIDTVMPATPRPLTRIIGCGDSFSDGTGSDGKLWSSLMRVLADEMGCCMHDISEGSTGYLNPGNAGTETMPFINRLFPPKNAWFIFGKEATGGSLKLTQGGTTTGVISATATIAEIQEALNAAFGAGKFKAYGEKGTCFCVIGQGANAGNEAAMTAEFSYTGAENGAAPFIQHWEGDLAPQVPRDGNGNELPWILVLAGGHNDTVSNNAEYTPEALKAAVETLLMEVAAHYPRATTFVLGLMWLPGGTVNEASKNADTAIREAVEKQGKKVNGNAVWINTATLRPLIFTGTGHVGNLVGDGNGDVTCSTDGVHPTNIGALIYGKYDARCMLQFLGVVS